MVDTIQAIVDFGDAEAAKKRVTTRHLQQHNGRWTGWNSDSARRERARILESHKLHQERAQQAATRVQKLNDELGELKGKRGAEATTERKAAPRDVQGGQSRRDRRHQRRRARCLDCGQGRRDPSRDRRVRVTPRSRPHHTRCTRLRRFGEASQRRPDYKSGFLF